MPPLSAQVAENTKAMDVEEPGARYTNKEHPPQQLVAKYANIFNESAFAYIKYRDAERDLEQAQTELEKQRPSFHTFPVNRTRFESKVFAASKASKEAKD